MEGVEKRVENLISTAESHTTITIQRKKFPVLGTGGGVGWGQSASTDLDPEGPKRRLGGGSLCPWVSGGSSSASLASTSHISPQASSTSPIGGVQMARRVLGRAGDAE